MYTCFVLVFEIKVKMAQPVFGESGENPVDAMGAYEKKLIYETYELERVRHRQVSVCLHEAHEGSGGMCVQCCES